MSTKDGGPVEVRSNAQLGSSADERGDAYFDDRDEPFDEPECPRCRDDGMDPWCDYLLPCPLCQGEQY